MNFGMSRRLRNYAVWVATQNLLIAAVFWTSHDALGVSRAWQPIFDFLPWTGWCFVFFGLAIGMLTSLAQDATQVFRPLAVLSSAVMLTLAGGFALAIPRALSLADVSWMGFVFTASLGVKDLIILAQPMSPRMDGFTDRMT